MHRIWKESNYVPGISLVAKEGEKVVGEILYTKCRVETETGAVEVLTFGSLCVDPDYQKRGNWSKTFKRIYGIGKVQGISAILICGVPTYYPQFGFKTADTFGITMSDGSNFDAFMGYELQEKSLSKI